MTNSADPDQLDWIHTVCKYRVYLGSAGQVNNLHAGNKDADDILKFFGVFSPKKGKNRL